MTKDAFLSVHVVMHKGKGWQTGPLLSQYPLLWAFPHGVKFQPFYFSIPLLLLTTEHLLSNSLRLVFKRSILGQYENFILENVNELKFTKKTTKGKAVTMSSNEQIFLPLFTHHKFTFWWLSQLSKGISPKNHRLLTPFLHFCNDSTILSKLYFF